MRKFIPRPRPRFFVARKIFHELIWEVTRCHFDNFDPASLGMFIEIAIEWNALNVHLQGERTGTGSVFSTCSVRHGVRLPPISGFLQGSARSRTIFRWCFLGLRCCSVYNYPAHGAHKEVEAAPNP